MVHHFKIHFDYDTILLVFISLYNSMKINIHELGDIIITNPKSIIEATDSIISLFVSVFSLAVVYLRYNKIKNNKE